jgi:UPF0176 protein
MSNFLAAGAVSDTLCPGCETGRGRIVQDNRKTSGWCIRAFYRFVSVEDPVELCRHWQQRCDSLGLRGILLVAPEGINSTMAGPLEGMDQFWAELTSDTRFQGITFKESWANRPPFRRMRLRLKKEIVTLGIPDLALEPGKVTGTMVAPQEWNAVLQDPDTVVLDVRNAYETRIGTFTGATDPATQTFRSFPDFVRSMLEAQGKTPQTTRIGMFCTGGIRCEKASAWMLASGFGEVLQLQGGILNYLAQVPREESLWKGACFVFDRRVAVGHDLEPSGHTVCYGCRMPLNEEDRLSLHYKAGVHCGFCYTGRTEVQHQRAEERMRQISRASLCGEGH